MSPNPLRKVDLGASRPADMPLVGKTDQGEAVVSNGKDGAARLSICIPTWRDSADALLASLIRMPGADECSLLIFDDGSLDSDLTRQLVRQIRRYPGPARLISAPANRGRSHARNRLMALAESEWILFLDADMLPDCDGFLTRYLTTAATSDAPALIVGGFSLLQVRPTEENSLHAAQSKRSECLPSETRALDPGRFVFTSNILVHRDIMRTVAFDPGYIGWGWEDVDWGLRVETDYPIQHIHNPATHLGLDADAQLIEKYAGSAANFARLVQQHGERLRSTTLYTMANLLRRTPGRVVIERVARRAALFQILPLSMRLFSLKVYRAALYGGAL